VIADALLALLPGVAAQAKHVVVHVAHATKGAGEQRRLLRGGIAAEAVSPADVHTGHCGRGLWFYPYIHPCALSGALLSSSP
jgi:hypothetical protein